MKNQKRNTADKTKTLKIIYEELFKFTDEAPIMVILSEEKYEKLCNELGIYGFDWYFVDENYIKYYKNGKWSYIKYKPDSVINYGKNIL